MEAGGGRLRARRDLLHPGVDALGLVSKLLLVELRLLHSLFGRGGAEQEGVPPHLPRDGDPQRGSDHNHRREDGGGGGRGGTSKSNLSFDCSIALSRFFFPTKHQGQTVSEITSIWIRFLPELSPMARGPNPLYLQVNGRAAYLKEFGFSARRGETDLGDLHREIET